MREAKTKKAHFVRGGKAGGVRNKDGHFIPW